MSEPYFWETFYILPREGCGSGWGLPGYDLREKNLFGSDPRKKMDPP